MRWFLRKTVNLAWFMVFAVVAAVLFETLRRYVESNSYLNIAAVCAPILAIQFAFAALMYSRARAVPRSTEIRRSLYAAERLTQAALVFLLAATLLTIRTLIVSEIPEAKGWFIQWIVDPLFILLMLYSFAAFYFGFRAISHRLLRWLPLTALAKLSQVTNENPHSEDPLSAKKKMLIQAALHRLRKRKL